MKPSIHAAVAASIVVAALAGAASAQDYPVRPIRIIVPFAPGGATDILARLLSARFYESMGQPVPVDNRPGAGGNIGAEMVAKAAPDGYTLLMSSASLTVNVTLYPKLGYNLRRDFIPITNVASAPLVLALHPSVPARSVKELIAISKQRKGGVNFGSNGSGTTSHLSGLLLNQMANIELTHVPYKGAGAAITAMLSGEVDMAFLAVTSSLPHVKAGRMRGLAVTTKMRSSVLPNLPTLDSMYPGFETDNWFALFAPAGTPQTIVNKIQGEVVRHLQHPDVKAFMVREGAEAIGNTQAEFTAFIEREIAKYAKLVKSSGARPDQ